MKYLVLFCLMAGNAYSQINAVEQGSVIQASKINEVIQNTNDLNTPKKIQHAFPIGTILSSILTQTQFQSINGDCWRLMNGASLSGTDLGLLTGMVNLPDMVSNGEFLRQAKVGRNLGTTESDAQQNITGAFAFTDNDATGYRHRVGVANGSFYGVNTTTAVLSASGGSASGVGTEVRMDSSLQVRTADEVRPKNIAVNMFIKVNNQCN
jgi:hypothetical protein